MWDAMTHVPAGAGKRQKNAVIPADHKDEKNKMHKAAP